MTAHITEHLREQIIITIQGLGYVYVGVESQTGSTPLLRIYVEGPDNTSIGLDEITTITRQLSALLDVESAWSGRYRFEVSSPGLDRRLFSLEDYQRFTGREVKLRLHRSLEGRRNWTGKLKEVVNTNGQQQIMLETEQQSYLLDFDNIEKTNLVPDYHLHKLGNKHE